MSPSFVASHYLIFFWEWLLGFPHREGRNLSQASTVNLPWNFCSPCLTYFSSRHISNPVSHAIWLCVLKCHSSTHWQIYCLIYNIGLDWESESRSLSKEPYLYTAIYFLPSVNSDTRTDWNFSSIRDLYSFIARLISLLCFVCGVLNVETVLPTK